MNTTKVYLVTFLASSLVFWVMSRFQSAGAALLAALIVTVILAVDEHFTSYSFPRRRRP